MLDLENPIVMGILNLTPDSFYDGGKFRNENEVIDHSYWKRIRKWIKYEIIINKSDHE